MNVDIEDKEPYPLETMLRIHLLQNWFSLSDPAMEEALYEIPPMRQFARLTLSAPIPEDTTIMNFRAGGPFKPSVGLSGAVWWEASTTPP